MWRGWSKCWQWSIAFGFVAGCGGRVELLVDPPLGAGANAGAVNAGVGAGPTMVTAGNGGVIEAAGSPSVGGSGPIIVGGAGRASGGAGGFGEAGVGGAPDDVGAAGMAGAAGASDDPLEADEIVAGAYSTCARLVDGSLRCWGSNSSGQLGNGSFIDSAIPVRVQGLPQGPGRVRSISLGNDFACVVLSEGSARCWGANLRGQLGNGALMSSPIPVPVRHFDPQNNPALIVSSGGAHSCALTANGAVQCWGANNEGQLGNGTNIDSPEPSSAVLGTPSSSGTNVQLAAGSEHSCMMLGLDRLRCWGANYAGQLGNGNQVSASNPIAVVVPFDSTIGLGGLVAGGEHTCLQEPSNGVRCWGRDGASSMLAATPVPLPNGAKRVSALDVGSQHACVSLGDSQAYCWGAAEPIGQASSSSVPVPIAGLPANGLVRAISAGGSHSCAIVGGAVYCWGDNHFGQLGVTGLQYSAEAVRVQAWD